MSEQYTYSVEWSEEDGERYGLCDQFKQLSWFDDTKEKALAGIRLLVAEVTGDIGFCWCCGRNEIDVAMHDDSMCIPCKYGRCKHEMRCCYDPKDERNA